MLSSLLSTLHLLTLALGLPSVVLRGRALRRAQTEPQQLQFAFKCDNLWGIASLLWLSTGLVRALGPFDKGRHFYFSSGSFLLKLALFIAIGLIEIPVMVTLIRWRGQIARGQQPDTSSLSRLAKINAVEVALLLAIPFLASMMARGIGHAWFAQLRP